MTGAAFNMNGGGGGGGGGGVAAAPPKAMLDPPLIRVYHKSVEKKHQGSV